MVTTTFLVFWGPYYALAIFEWINYSRKYNTITTDVLLMTMYMNAVVHPFIYGFFIKDVRTRLKDFARFLCSICYFVSRLNGNRTSLATHGTVSSADIGITRNTEVRLTVRRISDLFTSGNKNKTAPQKPPVDTKQEASSAPLDAEFVTPPNGTLTTPLSTPPNGYLITSLNGTLNSSMDPSPNGEILTLMNEGLLVGEEHPAVIGIEEPRAEKQDIGETTPLTS